MEAEHPIALAGFQRQRTVYRSQQCDAFLGRGRMTGVVIVLGYQCHERGDEHGQVSRAVDISVALKSYLAVPDMQMLKKHEREELLLGCDKFSE